MNATRKPPADGERGMILVLVLWLVAMMTVLVVALNAYARTSLSLASIDADRLRNQMVLESGVDAGVGMILATPAPRRLLFAGRPATVDLGGGATVEISIIDAAAVVDINRADKTLIDSLAQHLDVTPAAGTAIADAINKWRDTVIPPDQAAAAGQGEAPQPGQTQAVTQQQTGDQTAAEAQPDKQQAPETAQPSPRPGAFFALAQLYAIPGIAAADIDKFLPFIGLYSKDGKVNPMAASQTVLMSIPGLNARQAAAIMAARAAGRADDPGLVQMVGQLQKFLTLSEPKSYGVTVRGVSGPGVLPGGVLKAVVVLDASGGAIYRVINWSW